MAEESETTRKKKTERGEYRIKRGKEREAYVGLRKREQEKEKINWTRNVKIRIKKQK